MSNEQSKNWESGVGFLIHAQLTNNDPTPYSPFPTPFAMVY
jgi:hypothetical protein